MGGPALMVTRDTPWRTIGDVPFTTWERVIRSNGGPAQLAGLDAYQAAQPHSALALAMLKQESSYATDFDSNPVANKNPWNLKGIGGINGYVAYDTWPEAAEGWRERITSPTYKNGIYHETRTIKDLIYVYAPPYDQTHTTTDGYIDTIVRLMNGWDILESTTPPPGGGDVELVFGLVPHPPFKDMIVSKLGGGGFDRVAPRQIVGGVHHETQGRGSIEFYAEFFGCPGGERCADALVDYVIGRDGRIGRLNDPRGTRSPHANGGGVTHPGGLEGDGPAFVAAFNVAAINARNVSIEYEKLNNESMTPNQIQAGGALMAYWHDQDGQPWDTHPYVEKYNCVVSFLHWEFGTTDCGKDMQDELAAIQAVSKGIMRQYQTQGQVPPITTPPPAPVYAERSPIPALENVSPTIPFVVAEGFAFFRVDDEVRAIRDTPRLRHADLNAQIVGPVVKTGETFRVQWIFQGGDGYMYYITPYWTRIIAHDTQRVKDAV
jgi:hypothetical protein